MQIRYRFGLLADLPPTDFGSCSIRSHLGPWRPRCVHTQCWRIWENNFILFFYQKYSASEKQISNYLKDCMPRNDSFGAKSHTAWRRSRAVPCAVPCATMQKHQTKYTILWIGTFLQPFQMDTEEKKTEASGIPYNFKFIPMVFFAISHAFFRNRKTSAFAINYVFLSQLNYTLTKRYRG